MHPLLTSDQSISIDIFIAFPIKDWYYNNGEEEKVIVQQYQNMYLFFRKEGMTHGFGRSAQEFWFFQRVQ